MQISKVALGWMLAGLACVFFGTGGIAAGDDGVLKPIDQRFAAADGDEVPSFQKHVVNLFGRLGCNGRACHGSFQGRGGFQLSLFGYDFQADHQALFDEASPRVDLDVPDESLIIAKPTDDTLHEGGQRYELGGWQHHVFRRWIAAGAPWEKTPLKLVQLRINPPEIQFEKAGQQVQLQAVAVWEDGTQEDVTPLCRFQTNDSQVAQIDEAGRVTATDAGDTHIVVFYDNGVVPVPVFRPVSDQFGAKYPKVPAPTRVDELVVEKLRKLGIVPSELCSDAEFLRRVCLDMTGTLPTPLEVERFLADTAADKRSRKIDELLETPQYAAWWATKLCDFTGNNEAQLVNVTPVQGTASQQWYDWIYRRIAENTPYDDLVAGILTAVSRPPDQSYLEYCKEMSDLYRAGSQDSFADLPNMTHYWARRDFREVDARVIGVAYSFMGIRIECAQCHKHPFDQWSKDDFDQFKNLFAGVVANGNAAPNPETRRQYDQLVQQLGVGSLRGNDLRRELPRLLREGKSVPFPEVFVNVPQSRTGRGGRGPAAPPTARLLGGDTIDLTKTRDPRVDLMDWLRSEDNRFFAPAFVNRVWASYFHAGIVNPPDDLSLANPPSNKALLDHLARGFVASGFDMKWVHREIANSRTYQLSWQPNATNAGDERNFSRAVPRRLPAEVLYDAVQQATSSDDEIANLQRNVRERAIAIPGSGNRAGRARTSAYALTIFGRSTRESNCDCDRSMESSLLQTVYLHNDQEVLRLIESRRGGWVEQAARQLRGGAAETGTAASGSTEARGQRYLQGQIAEAEARIRRLRQSGDKRAAEQLQTRVAAMKKRLESLQPAKVAAPAPTQIATADLNGLIRQTYLRTVSRYPGEDEIGRARQYLEESGDPVKGMQDLLWALLNTKEFLVNH
ncbi:MAG: DUF1549 domain-containing protein [Pirellulaceae bacterium]|nr:DUF1549 domain-containing protein [Pirellulaceae bacterium]